MIVDAADTNTLTDMLKAKSVVKKKAAIDVVPEPKEQNYDKR